MQGAGVDMSPLILTSPLTKLGGQPHVPAALSQGKKPRYPLNRRLGGPQSRSGSFGKEISFLSQDPKSGSPRPQPWKIVANPVFSWWVLPVVFNP